MLKISPLSWDRSVKHQVGLDMKISPRTFYRWRALGTGPRSKRMAKGGLRVRRSWLDEWLDEPEQDIA